MDVRRFSITSISQEEFDTLSAAPLTLDQQDLSAKTLPDRVSVKSLCHDGGTYELDPHNLNCTCPDCLPQSPDHAGYFYYQNCCFHVREWLAYAPSRFLDETPYINVEMNKATKAFYECLYDRKIVKNYNGHKCIILLPYDSTRRRNRSSFKHFYVDDLVDEWDSEIDLVSWCVVLYDDHRFAFNWRKGCWTYNALNIGARDAIMNTIMRAYYPDMEHCELRPIQMQCDNKGVVGTFSLKDITVRLDIRRQGKYINLESNIFWPTRINIKTGELDYNSPRDHRFLYIKRHIIKFGNMMRMALARHLAKLEKAKRQEQEEQKAHRRLERQRHRRNQATATTLVSEKGQLSFGIKHKKGALNFYVRRVDEDRKEAFRFKKITSELAERPPYTWIFDSILGLLADSDSFTYSQADVELFIKQKISEKKLSL